MALSDLITAGFNVARNLGGEEIEFIAAAYPSALRVAAIFSEAPIWGEIIDNYGADRFEILIPAADFTVSGWGTVIPARRDIIYRYPDDLSRRETWEVAKIRLEFGLYTFECCKNGRPVAAASS